MGSGAGARLPYAIALLLVVVTCAVYWQVTGFQFVHYDEDMYVLDNPNVQRDLSWASARWAFRATVYSTWQPMVWLSYMADYHLNGLDPGAFHLTNLILHAVSTVLLFALLARATGSMWRSAFVSALFALHPQHVESVAWIAERKDVLSTLFWFAATLCYVRYAEKPCVRRYVWVVVLYALGLMAKPMLVTLPLTLLLLDYWPLGRLQVTGHRLQGLGAVGRSPETQDPRPNTRNLFLEKLPLLAMAAASSVVTYIVETAGGSTDIEGIYTIGMRVTNAVVSYVVYLKKTVWPTGLACFYPDPRGSLPVWQVVGSAVLLGLATWVAVRFRRRFPYVFVGWLWYVITLLPVIGLIHIGRYASADRFTYVPHIGVFVLFAWGAGELVQGGSKSGTLTGSRRAAMAVTAVLILAALAGCTYRQVGYWRDDITLFTRAIDAVPGNYLGHDNLGSVLFDRGDTDAAIAHFREAVRIEPKFMHAYKNLAAIYWQQSKLAEAEATLREALRVSPDFAPAHQALGLLLAQERKLDEAVAHLAEAVRLDPGNQDYEADLEQVERTRAGGR